MQCKLQVVAVRVGVLDVGRADLSSPRGVSAAAQGGEHGTGQRTARLRNGTLRHRLRRAGTQHPLALKYRY
jgi:hypothetical protein